MKKIDHSSISKSKKQPTYHHPEVLEQVKVLDYRLKPEELPKWIDVKTALDIQLSSQQLGKTQFVMIYIFLLEFCPVFQVFHTSWWMSYIFLGGLLKMQGLTMHWKVTFLESIWEQLQSRYINEYFYHSLEHFWSSNSWTVPSWFLFCLIRFA